MQFIRDIYAAKHAAGRPVISFEFFPPKTGEGDRNLLEKQIPALLQARPDYCSVTYGAGGSTRDKTLMIVDRIQRQHGLTALAHLTCVGHTRGQVRELLEKIRSLGCKNILALRGDPPGGWRISADARRLRIRRATRQVHPRVGRFFHRRRRFSRRPCRVPGRQTRRLAAFEGKNRRRRGFHPHAVVFRQRRLF